MTKIAMARTVRLPINPATTVKLLKNGAQTWPLVIAKQAKPVLLALLKRFVVQVGKSVISLSGLLVGTRSVPLDIDTSP